MKKLMILFMAAAMLSGCNNANKKTDEAASDTPDPNVEWVELSLKVEGMTCAGCENAVKAGVETLEGIATVESSHEEQWTKVKYDKSLTSPEEIEAKITETGYTVKGEI
jgi:copper chaperone CopZ